MPAVTEVTIGNLALGHLGIGHQIAALTERSKEARTVRRFYERSRNQIQSMYAWPNGTRRVTLAELDDNDWSDEFGHAYRMPDECEWFRSLFIGQTASDAPPPYRIVSDDDGEVIITDVVDAVAEISVLVEDPALWTEEQIMATSYQLAALMARTFDEDNASALKKEMESEAAVWISRAAAKDLNQQNPPEPPKSEFETCRN
jgi:TorA maturation chaperone TorD